MRGAGAGVSEYQSMGGSELGDGYEAELFGAHAQVCSLFFHRRKISIH